MIAVFFCSTTGIGTSMLVARNHVTVRRARFFLNQSNNNNNRVASSVVPGGIGSCLSFFFPRLFGVLIRRNNE